MATYGTGIRVSTSMSTDADGEMTHRPLDAKVHAVPAGHVEGDRADAVCGVEVMVQTAAGWPPSFSSDCNVCEEKAGV